MNLTTHNVFKQLMADSDEVCYWTERAKELFEEYPDRHPESALAKANLALSSEVQQFCEENSDFPVLVHVDWNWIAQQILKNAIDMNMALLEWSTKGGLNPTANQEVSH